MKTPRFLADLTVEVVRERIDFALETGAFFWRDGRFKGKPAGGADRTGRWRIKIGYVSVFAHRLAWMHAYGKWPDGEIDHINGIRNDNRLENLRDVNHIVNMQNLRKALCNSKTGFLGASPHRSGKFQSQITVDGRIKHLGLFLTAEEAHAAYLAAKRKMHDGCTI